MNATYVPRVTVYGDYPARSLSIAEAVTFVAERGADLILGAMRPGYLGREMVTVDDLARWDAEAENAAQWADVEAGDRFVREVATR